MGARNPRLGRQRVGGVELDPRRASRHAAEAAREDGRVAVALVLEDAELRVAIGVERAVAVEMIGLEVEEQRDTGPKLVHILELKARDLADDQLLRLGRTVEIAECAADVAGDRRPEHDAEELARGRLPVRPGNPEDRVRKQARAELELAPDRNPPSAGSRDQRLLRGHPGALDDGLDAVEQTLLLGPKVEFDAGLGKPARIDLP